MINTKENPVVILGLFDTAISTARCFNRSGIKVYGLDYNTKMLGFKSRLINAKKVTSPSIDETIWKNEVIEFLTVFEKKPVVIPTSDEFIKLFTKYRKDFEKISLFLLPEYEIIETIIDRSEQFDAIGKLGISVPQIFNENERITFPVVIKPNDINQWKRSFANKGFIVNNQNELNKYLALIKQNNVGFLIQKIIEGGNENNFEINSILMPDGKFFMHSIKKIRQFPDMFGTATAIEFACNKELEIYVEQIIKGLSLVGFTNIEFKFNKDDKKYYYIETNPRVWLQINFSKDIGLNFPLIYYNYLIGNDLGNVTILKSHGVWIDFLPDLLFFIRYRKIKKLNFFSFVKSWVGLKSTGLFSLSDPYPFIIEILSKFKIKK